MNQTRPTHQCLIIEDEPLSCDAYARIIADIEADSASLKFNTQVAYNCDSAERIIRQQLLKNPLDFVILDINLKASENGSFLSGEDLGLFIRQHFPQCKIMIITALNSNYRLNNLIRSINPESLLVKSEIDFSILKTALLSVLDETPSYTKSVLQLMRKRIIQNYALDALDRQILHQISRGAKLRHLCDQLPLSKSAIEHRKRQLKMHFQVDEGDDRDLILKAEELGFL